MKTVSGPLGLIMHSLTLARCLMLCAAAQGTATKALQVEMGG